MRKKYLLLTLALMLTIGMALVGCAPEDGGDMPPADDPGLNDGLDDDGGLDDNGLDDDGGLDDGGLDDDGLDDMNDELE